MREKRFGSRLNKNTFTIDFAGRKVVDDRGIDFKKYEEDADKITSDKSEDPHFKTANSSTDPDQSRVRKLKVGNLGIDIQEEKNYSNFSSF